jgi:hypothetical protein
MIRYAAVVAQNGPWSPWQGAVNAQQMKKAYRYRVTIFSDDLISHNSLYLAF